MDRGGPKTELAVDEGASLKTDRSNCATLPKAMAWAKMSRGYSITRASSARTSDIEAYSITLEDRSPILLVGDNEINLSLLKTLMRRAKRRCKAVHNGLEAVHAYERASKHPNTAVLCLLEEANLVC